MSLFVNTNSDSMRARNAMNIHTRNIATKMERLASGERINGAKDDAAGLSITNRMEAQHRGYDQAIRNTTDGMSLLQTADGALDRVGVTGEGIDSLGGVGVDLTPAASARDGIFVGGTPVGGGT